MATGVTHSKFTTFTYNSQDMTCSIDSINGVGITHDESDVTALCDTIHKSVLGQGTVAIGISGPFNNTASTGAHVVLSAANGVQAGYTLLIQIGVRAAPASGDAELNVTNLMTSNYLVNIGGGPVTWSAQLILGVGGTASWATV